MPTPLTSGTVDRRTLLLGGLGTLGLAACSGPGGGSGDPIRVGIFGNAEKLEARGRAIAKFAELNPDIGVSFEGVPSNSWPDKIATMIAGGNAPDVINLSGADLVQFAERGALGALDEFIPDRFRADLFEPTVLDLGRSNGKLYGAPIAVSVQALGFNVSALEKLDLDRPPDVWSYDQYADYCTSIHTEGGPDLYGTHDFGASISWFETYLLAMGKTLYDGQSLAASVDEVADWLGFWDSMRQSGAAVPPDLTAQFTGSEWPNSPLVKGRAVFAQIATQDLSGGYQALVKDTLSITYPPSPEPGGSIGLHPNPSSTLCLNARSKRKDDAVKVIDWFVSDPESAKILGLISGPPASKPALEAVRQLPDVSELDQTVLKYNQEALAKAGPTPPLPLGGAAMTDLMRRINEDIGFGKFSVRQGAEDFVAQAKTTLERA